VGGQFVRGDAVRNSMLSCASSVGGINVVTSDEDDVDDELGYRDDVDDLTTDVESVANRSGLHVGDTPTGSVTSPAFPPSSPRYPSTAATNSPQSRRTLAAAVREKADAIIAADSSTSSSSSPARRAAPSAGAMRNTSSVYDGERKALQQQQQQQPPVGRTAVPSASTVGGGSGVATVNSSRGQQQYGTASSSSRTASGSRAGGTNDDVNIQEVGGRPSGLTDSGSSSAAPVQAQKVSSKFYVVDERCMCVMRISALVVMTSHSAVRAPAQSEKYGLYLSAGV
jgi:hypothetical protein